MNKSFALPGLRAASTSTDWDAVFADSLPRVLNYVGYRVGDRATAEDLTGVIFVRAWTQRQHYQPHRANPLTWILGIARHVVADELRRPRRNVPLEESAEIAGPQTVEEAVEQAALSARLRDLLRQLPGREQELIALKYGADLTHREIATVTGLSESNVGTILHRTVQKLRESWDA